MDVLTIPDPATMIQAADKCESGSDTKTLTQNERYVKDLSTDPAHHQLPGIVYAVDRGVIYLEVLDLYT